MSVSDFSLPLRMTEARIEGQEGHHELSRDLLPAVWESGDFVATLRHPLSLAGRALTTKACQLR